MEAGKRPTLCNGGNIGKIVICSNLEAVHVFNEFVGVNKEISRYNVESIDSCLATHDKMHGGRNELKK